MRVGELGDDKGGPQAVVLPQGGLVTADDIMQADLPGHKHEYMLANASRVAASLDTYDKMCISNWLMQDTVKHLPRTAFPDMIYLTQGLIMLQETYVKSPIRFASVAGPDRFPSEPNQRR